MQCGACPPADASPETADLRVVWRYNEQVPLAIEASPLPVHLDLRPIEVPQHLGDSLGLFLARLRVTLVAQLLEMDSRSAAEP